MGNIDYVRECKEKESKVNEIIRITRKKIFKNDAERIEKYMKKVGMSHIVLYGKREEYFIDGDGTVSELTKFAAMEAKYDGKR